MPGDPDDFWAWWSERGRALVTTAVGGEQPGQAFDALTTAVHALHPGLAWEVGPGELSAYVLALSPEGDPELRAPARRWLLAAPEPDPTWSFTDHRPPDPTPGSGTLSIDGGPELDLGDVLVSARSSGSRFDVAVFHPAFTGLDETVRERVTYLVLDGALGENDVELWLGTIEATDVRPPDGFGLAALRAAVDDRRSAHVDADGRPTWTLLRGETADGPLIASAQTPLHPLTAAQLTRYAAVTLPYRERSPDGFPTGASLDSLREIEDGLTEALGTSGAVVAHQSCAGTRLVHLYLDDATKALEVVRRTASTWGEGRARVESSLDPGWDRVRHLRS
ncbi:DUF695 domain-containing protein [Marmoricola endophyticus]|uniref:DUF695 domain-containing protein n=1 Tax=Marmoricola endophyticus TaxID=2040280 RepID=UPI001666F185|nr:DUF695 domain-containing protein [Marmoricola endophyticus]